MTHLWADPSGQDGQLVSFPACARVVSPPFLRWLVSIALNLTPEAMCASYIGHVTPVDCKEHSTFLAQQCSSYPNLWCNLESWRNTTTFTTTQRQAKMHQLHCEINSTDLSVEVENVLIHGGADLPPNRVGAEVSTVWPVVQWDAAARCGEGHGRCGALLVATECTNSPLKVVVGP
jgi:hypothetical protein